ncbi:hypothetical protein LOC67_02435 [Stieleria sp. JC731]|uniref:hypothetical protein n=1 Tax=Pirellulaceae TaxID=2691357 RepID=UPI001E2DEAC7|nr:hypothetical protein [Stieleria sp. JC731]MCC9599402.1 hypothetical protein [Stieleria sp. JC731]
MPFQSASGQSVDGSISGAGQEDEVTLQSLMRQLEQLISSGVGGTQQDLLEDEFQEKLSRSSNPLDAVEFNIKLDTPAVGEYKIGDEFEVNVQTDVQNSPQDVPVRLFRMMVDLAYDRDSVVPLLDSFVPADGYRRAPELPRQDAGQIRSIGVLSRELNRDNVLDLASNAGDNTMFSLRFRVIGTGEPQIVAQRATAVDPVLIFGSNQPVLSNRIQFSPLFDSPPPIGEDFLDPVPVPDDVVISDPSDFDLDALAFVSVIPSSARGISSFDNVNPESRRLVERKVKRAEDSEDEEPEQLDEGEFDSAAPNAKSDESAELKLPSTDGEDDEAIDWRLLLDEINFDLIDPQATFSLLKLHLRSFRLIFEEAASEQSMMDRDRLSVIDSSYVDISLWLGNPKYQSFELNEAVGVNAPDKSTSIPDAKQSTWTPNVRLHRFDRLQLLRGSVFAEGDRSANSMVEMAKPSASKRDASPDGANESAGDAAIE